MSLQYEPQCLFFRVNKWLFFIYTGNPRNGRFPHQARIQGCQTWHVPVAFAAQGKPHFERVFVSAQVDSACRMMKVFIHSLSAAGPDPLQLLRSVLDRGVLVALFVQCSAVSVGWRFRSSGAERPDWPRQRWANTSDHMRLKASVLKR